MGSGPACASVKTYETAHNSINNFNDTVRSAKNQIRLDIMHPNSDLNGMLRTGHCRDMTD